MDKQAYLDSVIKGDLMKQTSKQGCSAATFIESQNQSVLNSNPSNTLNINMNIMNIGLPPSSASGALSTDTAAAAAMASAALIAQKSSASNTKKLQKEAPVAAEEQYKVAHKKSHSTAQNLNDGNRNTLIINKGNVKPGGFRAESPLDYNVLEVNKNYVKNHQQELM